MPHSLPQRQAPLFGSNEQCESMVHVGEVEVHGIGRSTKREAP